MTRLSIVDEQNETLISDSFHLNPSDTIARYCMKELLLRSLGKKGVAAILQRLREKVPGIERIASRERLCKAIRNSWANMRKPNTGNVWYRSGNGFVNSASIPQIEGVKGYPRAIFIHRLRAKRDAAFLLARTTD